jgi:hypothetical protein
MHLNTYTDMLKSLSAVIALAAILSLAMFSHAALAADVVNNNDGGGSKDNNEEKKKNDESKNTNKPQDKDEKSNDVKPTGFIGHGTIPRLQQVW